MRANSVFRRQVTVLAPLISEQEQKEILGKWAMMKSYSDYIQVNEKLRDLATKYHATLPRSAW
jgi:hypothetical protein